MFERADFARYTKHSKWRRANQSGHGLLCHMSDRQVAVNLIRVMSMMLTIDPPLVDTGVADEVPVNSE